MGSTASVTVMNYSFSSKTVTISQGGTVTWNFNSGQTEHSTTRTGSESWDSGVLNSDSYQSYERNFDTIDTTGTFQYVCKLHSSMTGTVIVVAPPP